MNISFLQFALALLATAALAASVTAIGVRKSYWFEGYDAQMQYIREDCNEKGYFYDRSIDEGHVYTCIKGRVTP